MPRDENPRLGGAENPPDGYRTSGLGPHRDEPGASLILPR